MKRAFFPLLAVLIFAFSQLACGVPLQYVGQLSLAAQLSATIIISTLLSVVTIGSGLGMIRFWDCFQRPKTPMKWAFFAIVVSLVGVFGLNLLGEILGIEDTTGDTLRQMALTPLGALAVGRVGPLGEERCFRVAVQVWTARRGAPAWVSIVVGAVIFGLIHVNPLQVFFASLMGLVLGVLYWRDRSIVLPLILHVINNGGAVIQARILGDEMGDFKLTSLFPSPSVALGVALVSVALCALGLTLFALKTGPRQ